MKCTIEKEGDTGPTEIRHLHTLEELDEIVQSCGSITVMAKDEPGWYIRDLWHFVEERWGH